MLVARRFVEGPPPFDHLARAYAARSKEHPTLLAYPTLPALFSALSRDGAPMHTRSEVLCALVTRWHETRDPVWSTILLRTFDGMLGRVRARLRGFDRADAECFVTVSFLEALTRVRPSRDPARIAMYVRQETRRRLFASLKRDDDEEDFVSDVDLDSVPDPATLEPLEDQIAAWRLPPERVTDQELLRACAIRGGLRLLTRHLLPDASRRNQEHFYRRLLKRRTRLASRPRAQGAARKTR
jgi:hypothetical protein